VSQTTDEALLPGAVKYGGVLGLASLATSGRTTIFGTPQALVASWMPVPKSVTALATTATGDALVDAALGR
jgi:hypothetical protein